MLQRIEYGCEGKAYQSRQVNEHRIDTEDCMKMSALTSTILDGTDYIIESTITGSTPKDLSNYEIKTE